MNLGAVITIVFIIIMGYFMYRQIMLKRKKKAEYAKQIAQKKDEYAKQIAENKS